jgi:isopentenyldiphosphate isomerase
MWEHELEPLFICAYNGSSIPSHPHAVCETQWMRIADLHKDHDPNPDQYAAWFKPVNGLVIKKKVNDDTIMQSLQS